MLRDACPLQALLQSNIARNADFAVMLGDAHLDALGEDTYTELMRGYLMLGGPNPEPRLSDSLVREPCFPLCAPIGRLACTLMLLQRLTRRQVNWLWPNFARNRLHLASVCSASEQGSHAVPA